MRRMLVPFTLLVLLALPSVAAAATRWDNWGAVSCWGGDPQAYGPTVGSSGYIVWQPMFVWDPDQAGVPNVQQWGQQRWAYRDSVWHNYTYPYLQQHTQKPANNYFGVLYVLNYVYDFDTGRWQYAWAQWWERDPASSTYYDTGYLGCRYP